VGMQAALVEVGTLVKILVKQQEVLNKQGSALSSADYKHFNSVVDDCNDEEWLSLRDPATLSPIVERLKMFVDHELPSIPTPADQVTDVQPKTLSLLTDLLVVYDLKSTVKTSHVDTEYDYEYLTTVSACQRRVVIKGRTDKMVNYRNIPIGTFKDKNINQDIEQFDHKAQAIVEVAAALEKYRGITYQTPRQICGLLTNRIVWKLFIQMFDGTSMSYQVYETPSFCITENDGLVNVNVAALLAYYLLNLRELEAAVDGYVSSKAQRSKRKYDDLIDNLPTDFGNDDGDQDDQYRDNTSPAKHGEKSPGYESGGHVIGLANLALLESSKQSKHFRREFELLSKLLPVRLVE
jgi:hypothetical protein